MTQTTGPHKSSPGLPAAPLPQSPAPIASKKDTAQIVLKQYAPPLKTLPAPPPSPTSRNSAGGKRATRKTTGEPPAAPPPPEPPASAAPQTMHNSDRACATSKACTRSYPACSVTPRYPVRTEVSATPTAPQLTTRSIPFPRLPTVPPKCSPNPRVS